MGKIMPNQCPELIQFDHRGLQFSTYAPRGVGGFKPPIHFHCVLHAKRGRGVQKPCKIAYVY